MLRLVSHLVTRMPASGWYDVIDGKFRSTWWFLGGMRVFGLVSHWVHFVLGLSRNTAGFLVLVFVSAHLSLPGLGLLQSLLCFAIVFPFVLLQFFSLCCHSNLH